MEEALSGATFTELWHPADIMAAVLFYFIYLAVVGVWRYRFQDAAPVSVWRKLSFLFGVLLLYTTQGSPLSYISENYLFSAHMSQMAIDYLAAPPFILLGIPGWLLRPVFNAKLLKPLMPLLFNPIISLILFNGLFSFFHIPLIFNGLDQHPLLHVTYHIVLLASAFQMWIIIICPVPEWDRMSQLRKMLFIFLNSLLLTPACALVIFAGHTMYTEYMNYPAYFHWLTPVQDQQLGGIIMKILQEIVNGTAIGFCFFSWYNKERAKEKEEELLDLSHANFNQA